MANKTSKRIAPKGERLGWIPFTEIKPVAITPELMKGQIVVVPNERNRKASTNSFLVP